MACWPILGKDPTLRGGAWSALRKAGYRNGCLLREKDETKQSVHLLFAIALAVRVGDRRERRDFPSSSTR